MLRFSDKAAMRIFAVLRGDATTSRLETAEIGNVTMNAEKIEIAEKTESAEKTEIAEKTESAEKTDAKDITIAAANVNVIAAATVK